MRGLLAEIRALKRAYYADHTVAGDIRDVAVAAICTIGIVGHCLNLLSAFWDGTHG